MKVKTEKQELKYTPIKIEITFETEEELAAFYAIFNHTYIISPLEIEEQASAIREEIRKVAQNTKTKLFDDSHDTLTDGLRRYYKHYSSD